MDSGVLERIRVQEADIENNLDGIVQQLLLKEEVAHVRHRLLIDHFVVKTIDEIVSTADRLADLYLDEMDIVTLRQAPSEGMDVLTLAMKEFDAKVADIREHRSSAARSLPPIRHVLPHPDPKALEHIFSPSECMGRCFHLEANFQLYFQFMEQTTDLASRANEEEEEEEERVGADGEEEEGRGMGLGILRGQLVSWLSSWEPCPEYISFIARILPLIQRDIPAHRKLMGFQLYQRWVSDLWTYLDHFYDRIAPLASPQRDQLMKDVEEKLYDYWGGLEKEKHIPWANDAPSGGGVPGGSGSGAGAGGEGDAAPSSSSSLPEPSSVHVHAKRSSGLLVPSSLRKHLDHFSLWPLPFITSVFQQAQSSVSSSFSADGAAWPEEDMTLKYFPRHLEDIKEVCLVEGKVIALLKSLLFEPYQYTEKHLRRNQGKTLEEQESERVEEEKEFLESFSRLQKKFSLHTVETTIAQAAQYHLDAQKSQAMEDLKKESQGKDQHSGGSGGESEEEDEDNAGRGGVGAGGELIGEDGKPIPRWLVQLQQLNKTFTCDVCGGTVYRGPKMFREHFGGDRHAEGLRRIGITEHLKTFEGIHSIRDVIELRDKLEQLRVKTRKRLRQEHELEEMQDPSGKVVTAGAYAQYQYRKM